MLSQEQNYLAPPVPSVEGFKAWLERQPQGKTFNYISCNHCAVGQYLRSIGDSWDGLIRRNFPIVQELNQFAWGAAIANGLFELNRDPTFGDVLREVRKVCP